MGKRRWLGALFLLAASLATFASRAGYLLVVDAPQPADVILVLAGETEQRPQHALQLFNQGYGQKILLDVPAEARAYGFSELELAQKYVLRFPEAARIRICPIEGLSTKAEAHEAERCLQRESGNRVLLVTSDFHTRRALNIFRTELRDKTFSVAAARDDREFGERWWQHREWAKTCVYEWLRLLWWSVVDRWQ